MSKLNVFQKILPTKGQKMNLFELSTGETIVLEKIESVSRVDNKVGFKGSLYEFTIHLDSGRQIHVTDDNQQLLIKEQLLLLKSLSKK